MRLVHKLSNTIKSCNKTTISAYIHGQVPTTDKKEIDHATYLPTKYIPWQEIINATNLMKSEQLNFVHTEQQLTEFQKGMRFTLIFLQN
jgi:hypothetical protein